MTARPVRLVDPTRTVLATAEVADEGGRYGGTIDLRHTPVGLRALFDEFEEVVNGQMFVFLDDVREKIAAWPVRVVLEDGTEAAVEDLQVFPSAGDVSFRLAGVLPRTAAPAQLGAAPNGHPGSAVRVPRIH